MATGDLPPDARRQAWATLLEGEIRELAQSRWVTIVLALSLAGLVVAAPVVNDDPEVWALAAGLTAFVVVPLRWLARRKERAEALLVRVCAG